MAVERHPWMKFYPQDWSGDEKLSMCSLAARGLLASCLHLMHTADPYGHLLLHGKPPTHDELATFVRCKPREVKWGLEELIKAQAVSLTEANVVFSRRMVRDDLRRKRNQENGRKNPGNPKLVTVSGLTHIDVARLTDSQKSGLRPMASGFLSTELNDRIADFSERYPEIYARVRSGAHYPANPVRDFPNFEKLVMGWPSDRLELMLEVFLLMPAKEANNVPGTPGQFLHMAPECDRRLREHGR